MTTNVETQPLIADEPKNKRLWWLNDESQQILNRGYLLKGETVKSAIERIANASAKRLYKPELAEAFIEMIERGWMSLSSPIWACCCLFSLSLAYIFWCRIKKCTWLMARWGQQSLRYCSN